MGSTSTLAWHLGQHCSYVGSRPAHPARKCTVCCNSEACPTLRFAVCLLLHRPGHSTPAPLSTCSVCCAQCTVRACQKHQLQFCGQTLSTDTDVLLYDSASPCYQLPRCWHRAAGACSRCRRRQGRPHSQALCGAGTLRSCRCRHGAPPGAAPQRWGRGSCATATPPPPPAAPAAAPCRSCSDCSRAPARASATVAPNDEPDLPPCYKTAAHLQCHISGYRQVIWRSRCGVAVGISSSGGAPTGRRRSSLAG